MSIDLSSNEAATHRFTRGTFILGSLGLAASLAGFGPLQLLGAARAAAAADGCDWIPWDMAHGLSPTDFRTMASELGADGYRVVQISGYGSAEEPLLAAIWEDRPGPDHIFELLLSAAHFKERNLAHNRAGYRLLAIDGCSMGGAGRYSGIWERARDVRKFRLGVTAEVLSANVDELFIDGYRLADVSGFELNGRSRFAGLWRKDGPPSVTVDIEMSEAEFEAALASKVNEGKAPVDVSAYEITGATRYAAIWTEQIDPIGVPKLMDPEALDLETDARRYRGQRLVTVDGHPTGDSTAHATIWRRKGITQDQEDTLVSKIEGFMSTHGVPGLSLAFAVDGRLVYARGFGVTANGGTEPVTVHSRFRIGSASKPITAAAIMTLVESGAVKLDDKVLGPFVDREVEQRPPLLGTKYGDLDWTGDETELLRMITVQHLLEHTAGWPNDSGSDVPNPMNQVLELDREALIDHIINQSFGHGTAENREAGLAGRWALGGPPGRVFSYSGFGYLLLTAIIEAKRGESYEDYVRQHVIEDPDSTLEMASKDCSLENEVSYHVPDSGSQMPPFQVWRRAGGGGWVASAIDLVRFMTRVDGENTTRVDAIDLSTLQSMLKPSGAEGGGADYGLGWILEPVTLPDECEGVRVEYGHGGRLPGANSVIACGSRNCSRYCWAALQNTESDQDIKIPMRQIFAEITDWPCLNLF